MTLPRVPKKFNKLNLLGHFQRSFKETFLNSVGILNSNLFRLCYTCKRESVTFPSSQAALFDYDAVVDGAPIPKEPPSSSYSTLGFSVNMDKQARALYVQNMVFYCLILGAKMCICLENGG